MNCQQKHPFEINIITYFSGDTSQAASLSSMTATIFDDLYPDSGYRFVVWSGTISFPVLMEYLGVKAGRHNPTDVIVGYGVGALVGYFIPKLHNIPKDTDHSIITTNGGLGISYSF